MSGGCCGTFVFHRQQDDAVAQCSRENEVRPRGPRLSLNLLLEACVVRGAVLHIDIMLALALPARLQPKLAYNHHSFVIITVQTTS